MADIEPDMFWDGDNPETQIFDSPEQYAIDCIWEWNTQPAHGAVVEIWAARRCPTFFVAALPEDLEGERWGVWTCEAPTRIGAEWRMATELLRREEIEAATRQEHG
jgi:hypothetical protein